LVSPPVQNELFQQATQYPHGGLLFSGGEVQIKICEGGVASSTLVAQVFYD